MEWNKQGRKSKSGEAISREWTQDELRVHKDPLLSLACAVVKQWRKDGSPKAEGITTWISIIVERSKEYDAKNILPEVTMED